jgi:hypothetical protein
MRKEFSVISVFTMAVSVLAGVVLCMQLAPTKGVMDGQLPLAVIVGSQLALFGTAVFVWRRETSLVGWVIGLGALLGVRLVVSAAAAGAMSVTQSGVGFDQAWARVGSIVPIAVTALFSVVAVYPLRSLLPAGLGGAQKAEAVPGPSDASSLVRIRTAPGTERAVTRGSERTAERAPQEEAPHPTFISLDPTPQVHGEIELPLRALLAGLPEAMLSESARDYGDDFPVALPLPMIVPQLKEGQVFVPLAKLQELLPPGVLAAPESTGLEGEPMLVALALEEVVPALPPHVLELPPPSPPAWAALPDLESVVFATV